MNRLRGAKTKTKPKTAAKTKAAPKAKKAAAKPKKKVSIKDLILKKFDLWKPPKPLQVKPAAKPSVDHTPPPFFDTSDKNELNRLKTLLLKKYDYGMLIEAAEKAAAEKAAAEKAAAEKAAAEKAAAEKAAAEKAAAEKAVSKKAAAEPKPAISYEPPLDIPKPTEPADKMMIYGFGGLVLLIFLVVGASFLNAGNYYIKPVNGALEIWQGKFAPKGARLLISLPGQKTVAPQKSEYSKKDVFPIIYAYYKDKAARLTEVKGMPDFDAEKAYLEKALHYSTTPEEKSAVNSRINSIDLMVLLLKADAAASRNTVESLTAALGLLKEAAGLDLDEIQEKQVQQKTEIAKTQLAKIEKQQANAKEAEKKAREAQAEAQKANAKKKKADADTAHKSEPMKEAAKSEKSH